MITWHVYLMTLFLNFILMFAFSMVSILFSKKIYKDFNPSKTIWIIACSLGALLCSYANANTTIELFYIFVYVCLTAAYLVLLGRKQFLLNLFLVNAYMLNIMAIRMCITSVIALFTGRSLSETAYSNPFLSEFSLALTLVILVTAMLIMRKIIPGELVYRITQFPALRRAMTIWMGLSNIYLLAQSSGYASADTSSGTLLRNLIPISILLLFANWAFLFYNVRIIKLLSFQSENQQMRDLMQKLNYAATTDGLTELLNKTSAIKEIEAVIPSGGALFVIDIDDFKEVNDTHGHTNGDMMLRKVAAQIKQHFRSDDIVGRFGGDEFIVFMANTSLNFSVLEGKAEYLCRNIKTVVGRSISVGILYFSAGQIHSFDEAFLLADGALYESKEKGKNTYVIKTL